MINGADWRPGGGGTGWECGDVKISHDINRGWGDSERGRAGLGSGAASLMLARRTAVTWHRGRNTRRNYTNKHEAEGELTKGDTEKKTTQRNYGQIRGIKLHQ